MGCGLVVQLELEPNFIGKILPLSDANEITSGPFMTDGTGGFPLLRMLLVIIQNGQEPNVLLSTLALDASEFSRNLLNCFRAVLNAMGVLTNRFLW